MFYTTALGFFCQPAHQLLLFLKDTFLTIDGLRIRVWAHLLLEYICFHLFVLF